MSTQNLLFDYFTCTLKHVMLEAKRNGKWDMGILGLCLRCCFVLCLLMLFCVVFVDVVLCLLMLFCVVFVDVVLCCVCWCCFVLCLLMLFCVVFFYPEHPSLDGCFSCPHQNHLVVEKLSHSHGVGPQNLGAQCGTYFGADEEVRGVVKVCLAVGMKVKGEIRVRFCWGMRG